MNAPFNLRMHAISGTDNHGQINPLSNEELHALAPSIYATEKHDSRSNRFTPVPTIDIVNALRDRGFLPMSVKQCKTRDLSRREFTKHCVRFRKEEHAGGTYRNEVAIPELVLQNANDGTCRYKLMGGLFRKLCLNGLVVADGMIQAVSISHTGPVMPQVIEGTYRVLEHASVALQAASDWRGVILPPHERLAFAREALAIRFGADPLQPELPYQAIAPEALLIPRRDADRASDLWTTFNTVQENAIKGGLSGYRPAHFDQDAGKWRNGRNVTSKLVKGIDQDIDVNRRLWALAENTFARLAA